MGNNLGTFIKLTAKYLEVDKCLKQVGTAPKTEYSIYLKSYQIQTNFISAQTTFC
jgi:hypothetical protein